MDLAALAVQLVGMRLLVAGAAGADGLVAVAVVAVVDLAEAVAVHRKAVARSNHARKTRRPRQAKVLLPATWAALEAVDLAVGEVLDEVAADPVAVTVLHKTPCSINEQRA